ncbi:hypothetical protein FW755_10155 [Lonepinella koalarum]|nr:hypothetical protein E0709_07675 [Lonepinella koalarum]TYG35654.1 hypothetical protein FW755_10155 [Lonepinella koalarum]
MSEASSKFSVKKIPNKRRKAVKSGRAFFLLTFALHEQRKSKSPVGRNPTNKFLFKFNISHCILMQI